MTQESKFSFIDNEILRGNLGIIFDHILELIYLSESIKYNDVLKSSFRKTTTIYTASIIEALLLCLLKKHKNEKDLARTNMIFRITKEIYKINNLEKIVLGKNVEETEKFKFDKINLSQINTLCKEHKLISSELSKRVDVMRKLRNKLHIGDLKNLENDYTKKDLEFAFSVAKEVKDLVKLS